MKGHDPEGAAARYLGGAMPGITRRRFEAHLVECPGCWEEVRLAGQGRAFAEAGRELAPHGLRDRIRGEVSLAPVRRRAPRRIVVGALVLAVGLAAAATTFAVLAPGQPAAIQALVGDFQGGGVLAEAATRQLPARLGDLQLVAVHAGRVQRLSIVSHRYRDAAGHRVTVYRADRPFPMADGARVGEGRTWRAELGGTVLLCSDRPFAALVVGDDGREVVLAARMLRLV